VVVAPAFSLALALSSACGNTESGSPRKDPAHPEAGDVVAGEAGRCEGCGGASVGGGGPTGGVGGVGGSLAGGAGAPTPSGGSGAGSPPAEAGQAGAPTVVTPAFTLSAVSVLQTLEVPLMSAGLELAPAERSLPLVAGKSSLFRASFVLSAAFASRPLLGVLDLQTDGQTHSVVSPLTPTLSSQADKLETSFTFPIVAGDLTPSSSYRVRVLEADTTPLTSFPESGFVDLGAIAMEPLQVVLVPFIANGFSPITGASQLGALRERLRELYPLSDVELSLAAPVTLGYVVNGDGDGWDDALNKIYELRHAANPASNVFYFGMLAPDESYAQYCVDGCILGYSNVADPDDVDSRGSIGVTVFPDGSGEKDAWDTMAHELGHAMGRDHAPCNVASSDVDRDWPDDTAHKNGAIAVYGYDFGASQLLRPRSYRDVMGYCSPVWISDYTYAGIFERLAHIQAKAALRTLDLAPPELFRLARVARDGAVSWLGERSRRGVAARRTLALLDAEQRQVGNVEAQVARVDHGGAFVWLPARALRESGAKLVDLRPLGGALLAL
jgi:hypothetical protein